MRHNFIRLALLPAILLAAGCTGDDAATDRGDTNNTFALSVQMPDDGEETRVGLTQKTGSKDMAATWQEGDQVQVIIVQGERQFDMGQSRVEAITDDGRQATIYFSLPDGLDRPTSFTLYSFTGIKGYALNDGGVLSPRCTAELVRSTASRFKAPMFCKVQTEYGQTPFVTFHHFGTYEVLHVSNESSQAVTFAHRGFDISLPWYQATASLNPADDGGPISPWGEWDGDADSDAQTIAAGSEATFISWYIPSGYPITQARLLAGINGSLVKSADTFTSTVSLQRKHAYHMYVIWDGNRLTFENNLCPDNNHPHMIDLGLPSGTKWACCNVGAYSPEEYGGYYAWGETESKEIYEWSNYKFCKGSASTLTKYCTDSSDGYNGFTDGLTELLSEDDAATANWGDDWRMPSIEQLEELVNKENTTKEWTTLNGVQGWLFSSNSNGNIFFIPAAGRYYRASFDYAGGGGYYLSRSLSPYSSNYGQSLHLMSVGQTWQNDDRGLFGRSVRPVRAQN